MELNKNDIKLLPLVALGLGKACMEMVIAPAVNRFMEAVLPKMELPSEEEIAQMIKEASGSV